MNRKYFLVLGLLVSASLIYAKTMFDYDHSVDFGKFRTYSWIGVKVEEPFWKDRVTNAVDAQLSAKGWKKVESGGDASIAAVGSTRTIQTLEPVYGGFGGGWYHRGWGWGGPGFGTAYVERTPIGTLHLDIFDAQTKKVVWHGACSDTLTQNPDKNEKRMEKEVAEVFKKFPPPAKN